MIKRIRKIIEDNNKAQKLNYNQLKELEWAHIYHDSIRGKKWLEELPLNIGRWAGNYAFFYVLNRILNEYKPKSIVEFGLGESSKFISNYIDNHISESNHLIIEQSEEWRNVFNNNYTLSANSNIKICNMVTKNVKGFETNGYENIENVLNKKFDFYIVDGPFGSKNYSRYDIVACIKNHQANDDFIIIIDDFQRKGEQQTFKDLENKIKEKKIDIHTKLYSGNKDFMVLATHKYKYVTTF